MMFEAVMEMFPWGSGLAQVSCSHFCRENGKVTCAANGLRGCEREAYEKAEAEDKTGIAVVCYL